jgi:hypothetical protein
MSHLTGNGITVPPNLEVLNACAASDGGFSLQSQTFDWSTNYYKKHGAQNCAVDLPVHRREHVTYDIRFHFFAALLLQRAHIEHIS